MCVPGVNIRRDGEATRWVHWNQVRNGSFLQNRQLTLCVAFGAEYIQCCSVFNAHCSPTGMLLYLEANAIPLMCQASLNRQRKHEIHFVQYFHQIYSYAVRSWQWKWRKGILVANSPADGTSMHKWNNKIYILCRWQRRHRTSTADGGLCDEIKLYFPTLNVNNIINAFNIARRPQTFSAIPSDVYLRWNKFAGGLCTAATEAGIGLKFWLWRRHWNFILQARLCVNDWSQLFACCEY